MLSAELGEGVRSLLVRRRSVVFETGEGRLETGRSHSIFETGGPLRSDCGSSTRGNKVRTTMDSRQSQLCGERSFGSFSEAGSLRDLQGILQAPTALNRHLPMLYVIAKALWATTDKLRANLNACEYKHLVGDLSESKSIAPALV